VRIKKISTIKRFFAVSHYLPNSEGKLLPEKPTVCPLCETSAIPCKIVINHYRGRKTGPCIPLMVVWCYTHKIFFTLYPHGHVPYGRKRIAPVALDGGDLYEKEGAVKFSGTIFDAALDASQNHKWPSYEFDGEVIGNLLPRFNTQIRHLDYTAQLLGIHPSIDIQKKENLSQILSIPGQQLHD
jgi:hypothetical protein